MTCPTMEASVSNNEKFLLLLEQCSDSNAAAIVLQSFIADNGPLSEAAAEKVRAILANSTRRAGT
jgi:hypothetical protein